MTRPSTSVASARPISSLPAPSWRDAAPPEGGRDLEQEALAERRLDERLPVVLAGAGVGGQPVERRVQLVLDHVAPGDLHGAARPVLAPDLDGLDVVVVEQRGRGVLRVQQPAQADALPRLELLQIREQAAGRRREHRLFVFQLGIDRDEHGQVADPPERLLEIAAEANLDEEVDVIARRVGRIVDLIGGGAQPQLGRQAALEIQHRQERVVALQVLEREVRDAGQRRLRVEAAARVHLHAQRRAGRRVAQLGIELELQGGGIELRQVRESAARRDLEAEPERLLRLRVDHQLQEVDCDLAGGAEARDRSPARARR